MQTQTVFPRDRPPDRATVAQLRARVRAIKRRLRSGGPGRTGAA